MARSPELQRLQMHSDTLDAINRLTKKYDVLDVLEYLREWVAFMDRTQAAANLYARQFDGTDDA